MVSARASILAITTLRQSLVKAQPQIIDVDFGLAARILFLYLKKWREIWR